MDGDEDRPLDFTPTERAMLEDMLTARAIRAPRARLEVEYVAGQVIGGWVHVQVGARPHPNERDTP